MIRTVLLAALGFAVVTSAQAHDRAVALTSHTPQVVASMVAAGLSELQGFLERGFGAFEELGGAGEFREAIGHRERQASARLFAGDPDPFGEGVSRTPRRGSAGSRAR